MERKKFLTRMQIQAIHSFIQFVQRKFPNDLIEATLAGEFWSPDKIEKRDTDEG
jgi:hypothetical protein